jgi:hypothetical protein
MDAVNAELGEAIHIIEFLEDNTERWQYRDNEGIYVDFYLESKTVVAMRAEDPDWKLPDGMSAGVTQDEVLEKYGSENVRKFDGFEDLWLSYDEEGNIIPFSDTAAFTVRFSFNPGESCDMLVVQDNRIRGSVF